jgi:hypothetical protein
MRYYGLADDVHILKRWHLGECRQNGAIISSALWNGVRLDSTKGVTVDCSRSGRALDFCTTSFNVPVVTTSLGTAMSRVAASDLQRIDVDIDNQTGFEVLNALRIARCLDEARSVFTKWTKRDHRADLVGQYREVLALRVRPDDVPPGAHVFRVWGWTVPLVVSEAVRHVMETHGCLGARFEDVT